MRILVSGASIAGPVLAYWLSRYGFEVTVVERSATLRKSGGHAVDLFRPAMDIVEMMDVLSPIQAKATGIERLGFRLEHRLDRRYEIQIRRLMGALSDRHLEIMRDDLSEILHGATKDSVDYRFGDSIASLTEDPDGVSVTFDSGPAERFDLVIGADGLHSNVSNPDDDDRKAANAPATTKAPSNCPSAPWPRTAPGSKSTTASVFPVISSCGV